MWCVKTYQAFVICESNTSHFVSKIIGFICGVPSPIKKIVYLSIYILFKNCFKYKTICKIVEVRKVWWLFSKCVFVQVDFAPAQVTTRVHVLRTWLAGFVVLRRRKEGGGIGGGQTGSAHPFGKISIDQGQGRNVRMRTCFRIRHEPRRIMLSLNIPPKLKITDLFNRSF